MIRHQCLKSIISLALAMAVGAGAHAATTDISTVPLNTYSAPSSTDVKPNVLFILDDSGSMDWDFMPDWACASYSTQNSSCSNAGQNPASARSEYLFRNSSYNGVYYNPAVYYKPPVAVDSSGIANTTTYPSMRGISVATGGDSSASSGSPNWKAVKNDAYGVQSTSTSNLSTANPYFFTTIAGEYCTSSSLKTCITASAPSSSYPFAAPLRWCDSSSLGTCQAAFSGSFNYARSPAARTATITVSGTTSTSVSGITVNSLQIMSGTASASTTSSTVASNIAAQINACTLTQAGNCQIVGYTASASGSVVTITAPGAISDTPSVTKGNSGTMTLTATAFSAGTIPGDILRSTIAPTVTSYPYPGSGAKATARTDCNGSTCTYAEEMTNYANWWAYYRTRMQMMKTSASNAFSTIDSATDISNNVSRFRLGYMSINNNTNSDFLNLGEFSNSQKYNWYTKLISANPGSSTPLRASLSDAGRLYAGKLNGSTYNGVTVVDPLQYSCQQNYAILSTDGFWNESSGYHKLDGSTDVGNQDAALGRPYFDGGSAQIQTRTSTLQSQTVTPRWQMSTSQLQQQTSQLQTQTSQLQRQISQLQRQTTTLQKSTGQLQIRSSSDSGQTWGNWSNVSSCTWDTSSSSRKQCQYVWGAWNGASSCSVSYGTSTNNNATWSTGTNCQTVVTAPFIDATSCTATTTRNSNGETTQCQTVVSSAYTGAATCSATTTPNGSGQTTQCRTVVTSAYANAASCAPTSTPDTNGMTTQCQTIVTSAYANAGSCTATTVVDGSGQTTQCRYGNWTTPTTVTSCAATAQSTGSPYAVGLATSCTPTTSLTGTWTAASSCTASSTSNCQYTTWSAWSNAASCTAAAQSTSPNYTVGTARDCQVTTSGGTSNTLADVAAYYYNTDLRSPVTLNGMSTGTCTGPTIAPATTPNDLCADNVPANGLDVATTQHMTTFTLGLGAQGQMIYAPTDGRDYWNDTRGDFYDVKAGTSADTTTGICSWQSSGACNWPTPASNSNANIDDLWHAAINGHGTYFSAKDPASLASGLTNTLAAIANVPRPGTAAAAASSNPNVSASDNYVFSSSYKSVEWYGELVRQQITTAGALTGQNWSAMRLLDCATTPWTALTSYVAGANYRQGTTCYTVTSSYTSGASYDSSSAGRDMSNTAVVHVDEAAPPASQVAVTALTSRTIYTKRIAALGVPALIPFNWSDLDTTQKVFFTTPAITYASAAVGLSQFCASGGNCLSSADQTSAAGQALVNFLRGDRSGEGTYFRNRTHVLGDIVTSEARYVKTPLFNYSDASYSAYKALMSSRNGVVYVGANDGMLHAFDATSGQELWAYVPETVLPSLYKLADKNYSTQHQFFVDDTPEVGDICPNAPSSSCNASEWKSILVGGLNRGGKGYYALDVTDPTTPKLLWEFTDTNLGYSYGNPRITKLKDGTWVVLLTSGYNNADGQGRVYVLNANTGALIRSISNGTGSAGSPSGLARLGAHALTPDTDNTTLAAYGGDTLGNLWRFDVNGDIGASGYDAQLLVSFKDTGNNPQPITAKPTIASVNGKPVVYVGTGRYLGTSDVTDTSSQSFYAVLDKYGTTSFANPRATGSGFVQQTLTNGTCPSGSPVSVCVPGQVVRTSSSNAVDWSTSNGWYIDFLTGGERASSDPTLGLGSLLFTTIRPQSSSVSACGAPGADTSASFLYVLNYLTGGAVVGANTVTGVSLGSGLVTRPVMIELTDGSVRALIRASTGGTAGSISAGSTATDLGNTLVVTPTVNLSSTGNLRRVSWRELTSR